VSSDRGCGYADAARSHCAPALRILPEVATLMIEGVAHMKGVRVMNESSRSSQPRIGPRDAGSGLVRVIVDTPKGSANKYKFDEELRCFKVSRILPLGLCFPFDFGSVPGTRAEDGDPLDVLVLMDAPTFPGCLVTTRLIGGIRARQREGGRMIRNDRLIGVPETPVNVASIRSIHALSETVLRDIEHFFRSYNQAQGRELRITSRFTAVVAEKLLSRSIRAFERRTRNPS
jgi:inorganic pyrophosphatase